MNENTCHDTDTQRAAYSPETSHVVALILAAIRSTSCGDWIHDRVGTVLDEIGLPWPPDVPIDWDDAVVIRTLVRDLVGVDPDTKVADHLAAFGQVDRAEKVDVDLAAHSTRRGVVRRGGRK